MNRTPIISNAILNDSQYIELKEKKNCKENKKTERLLSERFDCDPGL